MSIINGNSSTNSQVFNSRVNNKTIFDSLPVELMLKVLSYLELADIENLAQTCYTRRAFKPIKGFSNRVLKKALDKLNKDAPSFPILNVLQITTNRAETKEDLVRVRIARFQAKQGDYNGAVQTLSHIEDDIKRRMASSELLFTMAEKGHIDDAILLGASWMKELRESPFTPNAFHMSCMNLARDFKEKGDFERAKQIAEKATDEKIKLSLKIRIETEKAHNDAVELAKQGNILGAVGLLVDMMTEMQSHASKLYPFPKEKFLEESYIILVKELLEQNALDVAKEVANSNDQFKKRALFLVDQEEKDIQREENQKQAVALTQQGDIAGALTKCSIFNLIQALINQKKYALARTVAQTIEDESKRFRELNLIELAEDAPQYSLMEEPDPLPTSIPKEKESEANAGNGALVAEAKRKIEAGDRGGALKALKQVKGTPIDEVEAYLDFIESLQQTDAKS